MPILAIIEALKLAGTATPAFIELFNLVKSTFNEEDRSKLEDAYQDAMRASDAQHEAAQGI